MAAEADALCGAGYRERSPERVNARNGYRTRLFDTRVGTIDLAIPKLRCGSHFPNWLLALMIPSRRPSSMSACFTQPGRHDSEIVSPTVLVLYRYAAGGTVDQPVWSRGPCLLPSLAVLLATAVRTTFPRCVLVAATAGIYVLVIVVVAT
jgi:Transposase, Mutator family